MINDINFSENLPDWAKPEKMDVTFVDMSDASLSYSIKVPIEIEHQFSLDWWIEVRGERFYNKSLNPEGYKDDKSIMYNYTLTFESERSIFKKFIWLDIDTQSGVPLLKSYLNVFKLTLSQFADKLNENLKFYGLYDRWEVIVDHSLPINAEPALVNAQDAYLWDILQRTTEIYGDISRWFIEKNGSKLFIKIGYPAPEINHIFQYGGETLSGNGGLTKINRTLSDEKLTTILAGRGSERNIPERYFEATADNFPGDPDQNTYTASLNLKNLMPKCFRDYNRGWNTKLWIESESDAYKQGATDINYHPIEWVKSAQGINTYGEIWDKLQPNENIYPTIQAVTADDARAAGVITDAVGRLDQIIAVSEITGSGNPEAEDYVPTFDIWVKDIGFDLRESTYWSSSEMSVAFTTGWLSQSESYDFKIAGVPNGKGGYNEVYVYPDTSKINSRGERSAWRISLMKSDAELDTTGEMIPNKNLATQVKEDDTFFFFNINMPHPYILIAEKLQEDYLYAALEKIDHEIPVFSVVPDRIFCATFDESEKLNPGSIVRIANSKLIDSAYETLHIQSITLKYNFKERILPDWEMVVTDLLAASMNPVQRIASEVSALSQSAITESNVVAKVSAGFDKRYLRKDGVDEQSRSATLFQEKVSFQKPTQFLDFNQGDFSGSGAGIYADANGSSVIETDRLIVRKDLTVNTLNINQIEFTFGETVYSNGGCEITSVEDKDTFWRCYYDNKNETRFSGLKIDDQVRCQRYDPQNKNIIKYYWRLIVGVGTNYIDISKIDGDGTGLPSENDKIVQFGNKTDKTRQSAYVIDPKNGGSGTWFAFINSYSLTDKNYIGQGVNSITGDSYDYGFGEFFRGDRDISDPDSTYITYQQKNGTDKKRLYINADIQIGPGSSGLNNLSEWTKAESDIAEAKKTSEETAKIVAEWVPESGNNLFDNTRNPVIEIDDYWNYKWGVENYGDAAQFKAVAVRRNFGSLWQIKKLKPNTDYTFACWCKRDTTLETGETRANFFYLDDTCTVTRSSHPLDFILPTSYERVWYSFRTLDTFDYAMAMPRFEAYCIDQIRQPCMVIYGILMYEGIVEEGNMPLDWSGSSIDRVIESDIAIEAARNAFTEASDAKSDVSKLNTYVDGAFKDGVISESEAIAIEKYLNTISESEKTVLSSFQALYDNPLLTGSYKQELLSAKNNVISSISNLRNAINNAIADKTTTVAEKEEVDRMFSVFNNTIGLYQTKLETASKSITDFVNAKADEAMNKLAEIASDNKLTPDEKQSVKKEWDIIVAEFPINTAKADAVVVSKIDYVNTYNALNIYITPLLSNIDTTSDIIGSTFRSKFSNYYTEKAKLDKSISDKINNKADNAVNSANNAYNAAIEADRKTAELSTTLIRGGYLKNEMIDTDSLVVKNIYSKSGKFKSLDDGTLFAVDGDFSGTIHATKGNIGGLSIVRNYLTNEGFQNDAAIIMRNDAEGTLAAIGGNAVAASIGERILCSLESTKNAPGEYHGGLNIDIRGGELNEAIRIKNGSINMVGKGDALLRNLMAFGMGFRTRIIIVSENIKDDDVWLMCNNTQKIDLYLPYGESRYTGRMLCIRNMGSSSVRIVADGGGLINTSSGDTYDYELRGRGATALLIYIGDSNTRIWCLNYLQS